MKDNLLEVRPIGEFQGCQTIAYMVRGHHAQDLFLSSLRRSWGVTCDQSAIQHEHWRNVPQGDEGMICIRCKPGRGAYPVTVVDADDVVEFDAGKPVAAQEVA